MKITDRDVARVVLKVFAESDRPCFAPSGFYDDDQEVVDEICEQLHLQPTVKFRRRLFRVCNRLAHAGILYGRMVGTYKEYLGEPSKQRVFGWANAGYAARIHDPPRRYNHTVLGAKDGPGYELDRLLDRACPTKGEK